MTSTTTESNPMPTPTCLGTKTIHLRDRGSGSKKEAVVAIFHHAAAAAEAADSVEQDDHNNGGKILRVALTDGEAVYQGDIEMDRVKMKLLESLEDDKTKQMLVLAGYLLHATIGQVEAVYSLENNADETGHGQVIKLVIKYQNSLDENDEDAAMKKAWSGILARSNNRLQFYQILGDSVNQERRNLDHLKQEMGVVKLDRASWKDTAEQLSGKWEAEKNTLFHNFSSLYNKTRDELGKARNQIKELRMQLESQQQAALSETQSTTGRNRTKRAKKKITFHEEEEMPDQPDDNDNMFHDDDVVNALASGKRVDIQSKKRADSNAKKNRAPNKKAKVDLESDGEDEDATATRKKRPTKRASAKDCHSSDSESEDSVTKRVRAQIAGGGLKSSSDDDDDDNDDNEGSPLRRAII